jgi:hypothetical protein
LQGRRKLLIQFCIWNILSDSEFSVAYSKIYYGPLIFLWTLKSLVWPSVKLYGPLCSGPYSSHYDEWYIPDSRYITVFLSVSIWKYLVWDLSGTGGTWWRSWLKHCATSWKNASFSSIPDCVMRNCVMRNCVMWNCVMWNCVMWNCVMRNCIMRNCVMRNCVMWNCVMLNCVMRNCVMRICVMRNFHWHNPLGSTTALELTQPLREMCTRNISCWCGSDKGDNCVRLQIVPPLRADTLVIWWP